MTRPLASRWERHVLARFAAASSLALLALWLPALLLAAERGLGAPPLAFAYLAWPLAVLAGAAVTVRLGAVHGEWQILTLAGLSPGRVAAPLAALALAGSLGLALATPELASDGELERHLHTLPAGARGRTFHGPELLLAAERIEGDLLHGVVLLAGEDPPRRFAHARLRLGAEAGLATLEPLGGAASPAIGLALTPSAPLRRLRQELFRHRPIAWLLRLPAAFALPHLLLVLFATLSPVLLASLAMRLGLLYRPGTATALATLLLLGLAVLAWLGLRLTLGLSTAA